MARSVFLPPRLITFMSRTFHSGEWGGGVVCRQFGTSLAKWGASVYTGPNCSARLSRRAKEPCGVFFFFIPRARQPQVVFNLNVLQ